MASASLGTSAIDIGEAQESDRQKQDVERVAFARPSAINNRRPGPAQRRRPFRPAFPDATVSYDDAQAALRDSAQSTAKPLGKACQIASNFLFHRRAARIAAGGTCRRYRVDTGRARKSASSTPRPSANPIFIAKICAAPSGRPGRAERDPRTGKLSRGRVEPGHAVARPMRYCFGTASLRPRAKTSVAPRIVAIAA